MGMKEEAEARDAGTAIDLLEMVEEIARRRNWSGAAFGIDMALIEIRGIAAGLPARPAVNICPALPPDRRRR